MIPSARKELGMLLGRTAGRVDDGRASENWSTAEGKDVPDAWFAGMDDCLAVRWMSKIPSTTRAYWMIPYSFGCHIQNQA